MKKTLALLLAVMMVVAMCACGGSDKEAAPAAAPAAEAPAAPAAEAPAAPAAAPAAEAPAAAGAVTFDDYKQYLFDQAGQNSPDPAEFQGQLDAINSWEDIDQTVSPWNLFFTTLGLSTWEEFQNGIVKDIAVTGGPDASASGESGEPTGEPAN